MKILFLLIFLSFLPIHAHAAERIQNARTFQQGNRVMIEYDLTGDKPAEVRVSLKAKGESFSADRLHLEGDYGKNVSPGRKRLVWNVLQDYPRGFSGEYVWDISAGGGGGSDPVTGMEFVAVPGGCFSPGGSQVCLDAFSIGKYEVTQGQWWKVMGGNPSHFSSCGDDCPVEQVSWNDVQEFISKLNSRSDKNYRLPTEAEWHYACTSGGRNEEYCGGSDIDAVAWYDGNSGSKTHRVGTKQPNGLGIYDMSGNVWEWVSDWHGSRYPSGSRDSQGPSSGSYRVYRGGSWSSRPANVRVSVRDAGAPGHCRSILGFRLVSPVQ